MNGEKIKFSLIVPVYNSELYVDECIRSVLCQTYTNFEMILVDDGSTDGSGEICDKWSEVDARVIVFHQKNRGAAAARNSGIRKATGEYLIFLDSDDWWLTDSVLKEFSEKLEIEKVDVLSFNFCKSYSGKLSTPYFSDVSSIRTDSLEEILDKDLWIASPWNKVISSYLFLKYDMYFIEGITSEDIDWCLRLAVNAHTFSYTNIVVLAYRQTSSSVSHNMNSTTLNCLIYNIEKCIEIVDSVDIYKKKILLPYVSYQYGTLLYCVASSKEKDRSTRSALRKRITPYIYLLKYSNNPKIRALNVVNKLFGIRTTILMLSLMHKFGYIIRRTE